MHHEGIIVKTLASIAYVTSLTIVFWWYALASWVSRCWRQKDRQTDRHRYCFKPRSTWDRGLNPSMPTVATWVQL